jgi:predicted small lipoprotein YifL
MERNTQERDTGMKLLLVALAAVTFLAACGKKAPLRPPSSDRPPAEEPAQ